MSIGNLNRLNSKSLYGNGIHAASSAVRVVGRVRDVQRCPERSVKFLPPVCTFRIERRAEDGTGQTSILVEMRGFPLDGSVEEGDWVEVVGVRPSWKTVQAEEIVNLSTAGRFRATPDPDVEDTPKDALFLLVRRIITVFLALVTFGGLGVIAAFVCGYRVVPGA